MTKELDEAQAAINAHKAKVAKMASAVTDDGKSISAMINSIRKTGVKFREQINLAAASCIVHLLQHGNSTPANQLVDAVGPHLRNPLKAWFLGFGPFEYVARDEARGKMLYKSEPRFDSYVTEYRKDRLAFASKLMAKPFEEFTKEPEFRPFDFQESLSRLVKQGRAIADGTKKIGERTITEEEKAKCDLTGLPEIEAWLKDAATPPAANDNAEATPATVSA